MKKKIFAFCLTAVMSLGLLSGCGNKSENSWKEIQEKKTFVLGLDASFPPMGFTDADNNIVGFDIDLAKEVCKRLGIELKLQPIDWNAKEQELNTGNIDAIWNGFTINDDRKKQVLFTEPYMKNRQVLVVNSGESYSSIKDLEGKKVGLQAGSSAADALEKSESFKKSLKEVVEFKDNMLALMDLEQGGVDAVLMDEIVARYYIQKKAKSYKVIDEALAEEEYGIGFRKKDTELMDKFQETLVAMAKDGKAAEISNSWFGEDITTISK
jgi:polar amino acid transport system substrate-binding protein